MSMNGYLSLACGWLANDSGYTPQSAVVVSRLGIRRTCVIENKWMDNLMNTQLKTGVCLNLFSSDHLVQNKHKSRHDVQFVPYTACPHYSHEYCELQDRIVIVLLFLKNNLDDDNFHAHLQTCSKFSELFCFYIFLLQFSVRLRYSSTRCVLVLLSSLLLCESHSHTSRPSMTLPSPSANTNPLYHSSLCVSHATRLLGKSFGLSRGPPRTLLSSICSTLIIWKIYRSQWSNKRAECFKCALKGLRVWLPLPEVAILSRRSVCLKMGHIESLSILSIVVDWSWRQLRSGARTTWLQTAEAVIILAQLVCCLKACNTMSALPLRRIFWGHAGVCRAGTKYRFESFWGFFSFFFNANS